MGEREQPKTDQQHGGRRGDRLREGGPSQPGHLRPEIDAKDQTGENEGQISQNTQESSGLGSGQS